MAASLGAALGVAIFPAAIGLPFNVLMIAVAIIAIALTVLSDDPSVGR